MLFAGLRPTEVINFKKEFINIKENTIKVPNAKKKLTNEIDFRTIPIFPKLKKIIATLDFDILKTITATI